MKKILLFLGLFLGVISPAAAIDYSMVDSRAKEAPPLYTSNGLPKLVNYLVSPYKYDVDKARVLLAWIVYHISYDTAKQKRIQSGVEKPDIELAFEVETNPKTGEPELKRGDLKVLNTEDTIQQTLRTKKGICKDIAKLYQHMCQLAGLEVVIINGYACDSKKGFNTSEAHMWNAVKIDGIWYFVDPTWALQGRIIYVSSEQEAERVKKRLERTKNIDRVPGVNKAVAGEWFLVPKEQMIKTHFPFERRWQIQKQRVTFEEFLKNSCHTTFRQFLDKL